MTVKKITNLVKATHEGNKNLVGVAISTPYLDDMLVVEPNIEFDAQGGRSGLTLFTLPVGAQFEQINHFNSEITKAGIGFGPVDAKPEESKTDEENAVGSFRKNQVETTLFIDDGDTYYDIKNFKIDSIDFVKARLTLALGDNVIIITLLFRDATSNSKSFFAGFVDRDLTPSVGTKIIELVAERLSGYPLAYATSTADGILSASLLPIGSAMSIKLNKDLIIVSNATATIQLATKNLSSVKVVHSMDGEYLVSAKVNKNLLILALHA